LITILARGVVPRIRGKNKGDVLKGCERRAGEGIVGEEVGEGRERERVLFIGTQFSILYTSMYSPAEAIIVA
jgi:hypothetical protein